MPSDRGSSLATSKGRGGGGTGNAALGGSRGLADSFGQELLPAGLWGGGSIGLGLLS
jgi:hypothetical protein